MLAKKDFVLLRDMVGEVVRGLLEEQSNIFDKKLDQRDKTWKETLDQRDHDLKRDIRDEIHSCISASEARTNRRFDEMEKHIDEVKEAILDGISETVVHDVARIKSRFHMA